MHTHAGSMYDYCVTLTFWAPSQWQVTDMHCMSTRFDAQCWPTDRQTDRQTHKARDANDHLLHHSIFGYNSRSRSTQPCIPLGSLNRVPALIGGNVTSAGWQVTLCDPIWHLSPCSGAIRFFTFFLYQLQWSMRPLVKAFYNYLANWQYFGPYYSALWRINEHFICDRDISLEQFKRLLKTLWFV